tara:strand:- start:25467 stop:25706 length:240 start_codon:yes stop_codon:yes gene_type:complete
MSNNNTRVNGVVIYTNGLTTTFVADSWKEFAEEVMDTHDNPMFQSRRIAKVFGSSREGHLEEHTVENLREELAAGRISN